MNSAFTLIELLIVVAIIGILVGIGVPALRDSRQNAVNAKVATITAQLATAKTRYILDNSEAGFNGLADDAARFTALITAPSYILVNGVAPVTTADLLKGLGTAAALTVGNSTAAPTVTNYSW